MLGQVGREDGLTEESAGGLPVRHYVAVISVGDPASPYGFHHADRHVQHEHEKQRWGNSGNQRRVEVLPLPQTEHDDASDKDARQNAEQKAHHPIDLTRCHTGLILMRRAREEDLPEGRRIHELQDRAEHSTHAPSARQPRKVPRLAFLLEGRFDVAVNERLPQRHAGKGTLSLICHAPRETAQRGLESRHRLASGWGCVDRLGRRWEPARRRLARLVEEGHPLFKGLLELLASLLHQGVLRINRHLEGIAGLVAAVQKVEPDPVVQFHLVRHIVAGQGADQLHSSLSLTTGFTRQTSLSEMLLHPLFLDS